MTQSPTTIPLTELKSQQQARVVRVDGDDALSQRLSDLGIWPDVDIALIRKAPLGDPAEYSLHGYRLALRRDEAARIQVLVN